MSKNKKLNSLSDLGLVFSSGDAPKNYFEDQQEKEDIIDPASQSPRIFLDRKKRKGKAVTIIAYLEEYHDRLVEMGKLFKTKCGVGGSVKDGEIMLQGDQRDKILKLLIEMGYTGSKKSGG